MSGLVVSLICNHWFCWPENYNPKTTQCNTILTFLPSPKYQNSPIKVAPQPKAAVAPSSYWKSKSSLTLPWKSTTKGLLSGWNVLSIRTAFEEDDEQSKNLLSTVNYTRSCNTFVDFIQRTFNTFGLNSIAFAQTFNIIITICNAINKRYFTLFFTGIVFIRFPKIK